MRASTTRVGLPLAFALACVLALAASAPTNDTVYGTYRLQGRARVDARPFPAADQEVRADAVLSPGARAGEVRIHLAAQGFACELAASRDAAGTLALPPGQRCAADLRSDEAEGRVEAHLVAGSGSARGEVLELALDFTLSGSVRARPGGTLEALGRALAVPGTRGDPLPVSGRASGRAHGLRDHSRAAQ